jgi:hypothetical protein
VLARVGAAVSRRGRPGGGIAPAAMEPPPRGVIA